MGHTQHQRVCLDPSALNALKRDGMGWGHDLECGCFDLDGQPVRQGLMQRLATRLKKGKADGTS